MPCLLYEHTALPASRWGELEFQALSSTMMWEVAFRKKDLPKVTTCQWLVLLNQPTGLLVHLRSNLVCKASQKVWNMMWQRRKDQAFPEEEGERNKYSGDKDIRNNKKWRRNKKMGGKEEHGSPWKIHSGPVRQALFPHLWIRGLDSRVGNYRRKFTLIFKWSMVIHTKYIRRF